MVCMAVEINTSRAISAQIIRHRSFHFQEFSLRYSELLGLEDIELRSQDNKNRQKSIDNISDDLKNYYKDRIELVLSENVKLYNQMLADGVAKESARMVLPLNTQTRLYMQGTVRDWIHYINLRTENGVQKEHRDIATEIKNIFIEQLPIIAEALEWTKK